MITESGRQHRSQLQAPTQVVETDGMPDGRESAAQVGNLGLDYGVCIRFAMIQIDTSGQSCCPVEDFQDGQTSGLGRRSYLSTFDEL